MTSQFESLLNMSSLDDAIRYNYVELLTNVSFYKFYADNIYMHVLIALYYCNCRHLAMIPRYNFINRLENCSCFPSRIDPLWCHYTFITIFNVRGSLALFFLLWLSCGKQVQRFQLMSGIAEPLADAKLPPPPR